MHPVLVRTGSGDFYDDLAFRFTGPVQLARDGRLGNRLINTDCNNFAPRLGIAYSPSAKWSFRTGFGVFFSQESKNSIFDMSRADRRPRQSGRSISRACPRSPTTTTSTPASCRCRSRPA